MIVDGASSHRSKDLAIPENIRLYRLPRYAPELNPQEHVWDELREKEFPNRVFDAMDGVVRQLESGLPRLAANHAGLRSLTAFSTALAVCERDGAKSTAISRRSRVLVMGPDWTA